MKKVFKGVLICLLVVVVALVALQFIFKDKIIAKAQEEMDKSLNAKISVGNVDLSILKNIKNFPDVGLDISDLVITGKDAFKNDTLLALKNGMVSLDIKSVISGENMNIHAVELDGATVHAIVLKDGKANWDIVKPSNETTSTSEESKPFRLSLEKIKLSNATILYDDYASDMHLKAVNINHTASADFAQDIFDYNSNTSIEKTTFVSGLIPYLSNAKIQFDGIVNIDQKNSKYSFKENKLALNDLALKFDGNVDMKDTTAMGVDVKFKAEKADFKSFLSLIPAIYQKDFDKIKTSGTLALDGFAKGKIQGENYPAYGLNINVGNGSFQYPSLPAAISNIFIDAAVSSSGGNLDNTIVDIRKMNLNVDKEPVELRLKMTTPISDPNVDLFAKGKLNLADVQKFYPMEGVTKLTGLAMIDLDVKTRKSDIDNKRYENVKAAGKIQVAGLQYASKDVPKPVTVNNLLMSFTPQYVDMPQCDMIIGNSDFNIKGKLENVVGYVLFKGAVLSGNINVASKKIDANEYLTPSSDTATSSKTSSSDVVRIPDNVILTGTASIGELLYDKIKLTNLQGAVGVKDEMVSLNNLSANLFGGSAKVNGFYNSKPQIPVGNLSYNIESFDFKQVFNYVSSAQKLAPVLEYMNGIFSSDLNIQTELNSDLSPNLSTLTGSGVFKIPSASITSMPALVKIAELTKLTQLNNLALKDVSVKMNIQNGKIAVEPFDVKVGTTKLNISGFQGLDQIMDYKVSTEVPWKDLGAASGYVDGLLAKAPIPGLNNLKPEIIRLNMNVGGTFKNPIVKMGKPEAVGGGKSVTDVAKETAKEQLNQVKQQAQEKIKNTVDSVKTQVQQQVNQKVEETKQQVQQQVEQKKNELLDNFKKKLPW